ncbi:DUF6600 domain-containing protein [Rhizobacter sp. LjRoot28]|uniref:DUF6600 domain-containing protein n=1 Tax=Rhizobacter sp. LjRoot28 TaxID=3342309 RepID=UPI003ECD4984
MKTPLLPAVASRRLSVPAALWLALLLTALTLVSVMPAHAEERIDPPSRVGRLAEVDGDVSIFDTEAGEWVDAVRNRPVTSGDRLSSSRRGRAEIQVGSTVVYLAEDSELEVVALDDERISLRLLEGDVAVHLRSREAVREFDLVTPEGRFRPEAPGTYRFGRDDDTTEAATFDGQLQLNAPDAGVTVKAGQRYRFWQDGGTQFELIALRRDGFDSWVAERADDLSRSPSARYVSPEVPGVQDLDRHGRWEQDVEYGALWIPYSVGPSWAPYRSGHWAWVSPWGWTWVDDAPWGFAPFHYGRWLWRGNVWAWSPGRYVARPVYAPALVAWVGSPGVSVSINVGRRPPPTVGWFPLGPREIYVPGYRFSPHYMRHVNDNHLRPGFDYNPYIRDPHGALGRVNYRHHRHPHALTVVPSYVVERRQPVAPAIIGMNGRPLPEFRDRIRPDAPVMPGGRNPATIGARPAPPQAGIPASPWQRGDRVREPRPGRGEFSSRPDDGRSVGIGQDDRQDGRRGDRWTDRRGDAPDARNDGRDDRRDFGRRGDGDRRLRDPAPAPQPQTGLPSRDGGRRDGPPAGEPLREERWRQLRPSPGQADGQPRPAPRIEASPAMPEREVHRPGGFNHLRPQPRMEPSQPAVPQPAAPQFRAPPQMQQPAPSMQPAPAPQRQFQPPPQRSHSMNGNGGNAQDGQPGLRNRRMD